jgi:signal transduction histidine kinase
VEPQPITTIPLGTIVGLAVGLLALGLAVGWYAAHSRWQRRQARRSQQGSKQLQSVLDALPFAALIHDAKGAIIAHNKDAAQFLAAFNRGDTVPLTVDAAVGRVIRSQVAESLELLRPGSEQRVHVLIAPVVDGDTAVTHTLILFNQPAAAPQQLQTYQQLVSAIGHELRTPLTAIMGHADIIGSCQIEEEALWRRSLTFVTAEVERLARLVEDLLHLSRLDFAPPRLRPTNLRLVAEEAVSTLFDVAQAQDVSLILQTANRLPRVQADPDRIRQVFLNLLDNAIKYAPGSTVIIHLEQNVDGIRTNISDTGPGIAPDALAHLFEPLFRGQQPAAIPGTGLGLTIVRRILEQHGTAVHVHSQLNKGTTFTFSLPLAAAD